MVQETYGSKPRLLPAERHNSYGAPPEVLPRVAHQSHEMNWVQACRGEAKPSAPFEYSAALNETMLLPIVALRAGQGKKILYDSANMKVTNVPEANAYLTREYRKGWEL